MNGTGVDLPDSHGKFVGRAPRQKVSTDPVLESKVDVALPVARRKNRDLCHALCGLPIRTRCIPDSGVVVRDDDIDGQLQQQRDLKCGESLSNSCTNDLDVWA